MTRRVVGLTGGIGVGKTTAAAILQELGAVVVDCDQLGRDVAKVGGAAYDGIVARFGPTVVGPEGEIDRTTLATIVFNDCGALADLNAITHPAIDAEIARCIAVTASDSVVIIDMAVLVESQLGQGQYNEVVVIEAPLAARLDRLRRQRGMSVSEARARIASQATDDERRAVADVVLVNHGDLSQFRADVEQWWARHPRGS